MAALWLQENMKSELGLEEINPGLLQVWLEQRMTVIFQFSYSHTELNNWFHLLGTVALKVTTHSHVSEITLKRIEHFRKNTQFKNYMSQY